MTPTRHLFVCSGNICRSPMAEHFARSLVDDVDFASAGTTTSDGLGPSTGAVAAMAEVGIDLTHHRSRDVWGMDLAETVVYALHTEHLEQFRLRRPDVDVHLLDPEGRSIADPYGSELAAYRVARDAVWEAVSARAAEWGTVRTEHQRSSVAERGVPPVGVDGLEPPTSSL